MSDTNGWAEWSKHVLKELERLNENHEGLRTKIEEVQQSIATIRGSENVCHDVKAWKEKVDEVVSPTQLKELVKTVEDLKSFRIKAITAFVVVQGVFGLVLAIMKFL